MGRFDGVLLVSDYDDTLLGTDAAIPAANLTALREFIDSGGRFTVATGRAHRTFAAHVGVIPMNAPAVLSNGSTIYDFEADRVLVQTFLPESAPADFAETCRRFPELGFESYHGEDIYVYNPNAITDAHMRKVGTDYTECAIERIPVPWSKAIFQQEHAVLKQVRDHFLAHYGDRYEAIFSNKYLLEITAKGYHKGGMVTALAQMLGIDRAHIYCVGDNENDIPMLEISAIPFAPSSCAAPVRDWGATLLCHCDEGVIAPIVEILKQRYPET